MKILYIANDSSVFGGANNSLIDMVCAMKELGHEPVVLTWNKNWLYDELSRLNIPCTIFHFLPCACPIDEYPGFFHRVKMHLYNKKQVYLSRKIIREIAPDIIHSNASNIDFGALLANYHHIPHVWHVREVLMDDVRLKPNFPKSQQNLFKRSSAAIYISDFVKNKTLFKNDNAYTILNGLSIDKYLAPETDRFADKDTIKLLYVGLVRPAKGTMDAIMAVRTLKEKYGIKNLTLKIVGSGNEDYLKEIDQIIDQYDLKDNIEFFEPSKDLAGFRNWADITLVCSRSEALGRVTIEGMLSGTLVIGANLGATPEIIKDGETGYLYDPSVPDSLGDKIFLAYSDTEKSRKIAQGGQSHAKVEFDSMNYAKKISAIYDSILPVAPALNGL